MIVWRIVVSVVSNPLFAMFLGTALSVLVPYARKRLERTAETGHWAAPDLKFDFRYLAMFLAPSLTIIVQLMTTRGLWDAVFSWEWTYAVMLGYSGSDISKEVAKAGSAVVALFGRQEKD